MLDPYPQRSRTLVIKAGHALRDQLSRLFICEQDLFALLVVICSHDVETEQGGLFQRHLFRHQIGKARTVFKLRSESRVFHGFFNTPIENLKQKDSLVISA